MKVRVIAMLLAFVMAFSLVGCADKGSNADGETTDNGVASTDNSAVSAVSDGRVLYEAAMQMVYDGDMEGGIEGLRKAVDAEVAEDWQPSDITYAWWRMAQIYRLLDDAEGEAKVKEDYAAATGKELLDHNEYSEKYFNTSPFEDWDSNVLLYELPNDFFVGSVYYDAMPEKAAEMGDAAFFDWVIECVQYNQREVIDAMSMEGMTLREYKEENAQKSYIFETEYYHGLALSFYGIMNGMTRAEVCEQLQVTPWCYAVLNSGNDIQFNWGTYTFSDGSKHNYLSFEVDPYTQAQASEYDTISFQITAPWDAVEERFTDNIKVVELKLKDDVVSCINFREFPSD